ncbi:unnamed protein product [Kuraishia capsulata CBS 1993]|uniref:Uncharacterized protein n=1 Tax=Kuraishia capsulata CBS 1993 TaxID=1382522 RepID=W6MS53_9ASCO|nr:uncharacterized protein KUCA_T00000616001 [Kuraishia capsulata CBS 1993]CDK24650.1 unnamed protein product [Kuraishia capsulata CBS 1993]
MLNSKSLKRPNSPCICSEALVHSCCFSYNSQLLKNVLVTVTKSELVLLPVDTAEVWVVHRGLVVATKVSLGHLGDSTRTSMILLLLLRLLLLLSRLLDRLCRRGRLVGRRILLSLVLRGFLRSVQASLDEIFAFRFCHQRLKLGGGEGVDESSFGHDEQKHLGSGQHRKLVSLLHDASLTLRESDVASGLVLNEANLNLSALASELGVVIVIIVRSLVEGLVLGRIELDGVLEVGHD